MLLGDENMVTVQFNKKTGKKYLQAVLL